MNAHQFTSLCARFDSLRIGVLGDYCVDAYWLLDETAVELSLETGRPTHAVCAQQYSLGGAGNVAHNLAALGVGAVRAFGVVGDDVFGREMIRLMDRVGIDAGAIIVQDRAWNTVVYAKPYVDLDERDRIDFGRFNTIAAATVERLLAILEQTMPELDALIINQQIRPGIHSDAMTAGLQALINAYPDKIVILDARDVADRYSAVICKVNAVEAAGLCGEQREISAAIPVNELVDYARRIHERTGRAVVITRSDRGILAFDGTAIVEVPGILNVGPIDPVGAGDTTVAAVAASLAAGESLAAAVELANCAAGVTVRKLRQTGTATQPEIQELMKDIDYVYRPESAEDIRKATYLEGTEIELINFVPSARGIQSMVFDHDGTLSTLRQGWEQIMEPVMIRAILGVRYDAAPEELYQRVRLRVAEYIEQSTGIEKILAENRLSGESLVMVGDGPVELRLCKRAGGVAIGVASDEVRRYGLNEAKRTRLIKAGADVIIADFSQSGRLLEVLNLL